MYVVYGVSQEHAKQKAAKKAKAKRPDGTFKTTAEFNADFAELAQKYFDTMRPAKLSPTYSNLTEAMQYMEIAKASGMRALGIKKLVKVGFDPKKQKDLVSWQPCA